MHEVLLRDQIGREQKAVTEVVMSTITKAGRSVLREAWEGRKWSQGGQSALHN